MPRTYVLRGRVAVLVDWLKAHPEVREIPGKQAGEIMGVRTPNVFSTITVAIKHEALFSRREGRQRFFSLTPYPVDPQPERPPFSGSLWHDGDLAIAGRGIEVREDGSVLIEADAVAVIKRLLNGTVVAS
jgi:hypothetical protein